MWLREGNSRCLRALLVLLSCFYLAPISVYGQDCQCNRSQLIAAQEEACSANFALVGFWAHEGIDLSKGHWIEDLLNKMKTFCSYSESGFYGNVSSAVHICMAISIAEFNLQHDNQQPTQIDRQNIAYLESLHNKYCSLPPDRKAALIRSSQTSDSCRMINSSAQCTALCKDVADSTHTNCLAQCDTSVRRAENVCLEQSKFFGTARNQPEKKPRKSFRSSDQRSDLPASQSKSGLDRFDLGPNFVTGDQSLPNQRGAGKSSSKQKSTTLAKPSTSMDAKPAPTTPSFVDPGFKAVNPTQQIK